MEKIKVSSYAPVELEIIRYEYIDIITTSGVNNGNDYVPDDNVDDSW